MDTLSTHNCSPESRVDDLLRSEVLQAFDRATFERDGYWVWEGILTDAAVNGGQIACRSTADERCDPHGYGVACYRL